MNVSTPHEGAGHEIDLVGGPFAVIESDPGVFTMLLRKLGVKGLEVTELYDIESWEVDHLNPLGLIFCYLCADEVEEEEGDNEFDVPDPDADNIWFANQLSDDACASQAILNIILNCQDVELDENLHLFQTDTEKMNPVMKGLSITNSEFIREAQNSLARPTDLRAAQHSVASKTLDDAKGKKPTANGSNSPSTKKRKSNASSAKRKKTTKTDDKQETYHFIGYVPCNGKVWELDGLRISGPLEVGELPLSDETAEPAASRRSWMDIVRPALKMKMQRYLSGAGNAQSDHIRYNLLAIVEDRYQKASDTLEMLKRERSALERRLNETYPDGWEAKVDPSLPACASVTFTTSAQPSSAGPTFAQDFGSEKMEKELSILDMPTRSLIPAWETCVRAAMTAKAAVEDEIATSMNSNKDHIARTFDYEPFIETFITCMHDEGHLQPILSGKNTSDTLKSAGSAKSKSKKKSKR